MSRDVKTFGDALALVEALPYGRNSDRSNPDLVLAEEKGTCNTKHALLALLAQELELDVQLTLGIYEMDETNTPGVGEVLKAAGLDALPEAHCYLRAGKERIDITRCVSPEKSPFARLLHEEVINPAQIGAYKVEFHHDFIRKWAIDKGFDPLVIWEVREQCISAL